MIICIASDCYCDLWFYIVLETKKVEYYIVKIKNLFSKKKMALTK